MSEDKIVYIYSILYNYLLFMQIYVFLLTEQMDLEL